MTQQEKEKLTEELKGELDNKAIYERDYKETSNDQSIPRREKLSFLTELAKIISSTLDRIRVLEERLKELSDLESEQQLSGARVSEVQPESKTELEVFKRQEKLIKEERRL
jgi:hypothetical protein